MKGNTRYKEISNIHAQTPTKKDVPFFNDPSADESIYEKKEDEG
jgi:hypothetical protein